MVGITYLILTKGNGQIAAGTIQTVTNGFKPEGWLECDGSEYDPLEYPELYDVLVNEVPIRHRTWLDKLLGKKGKIIGYRYDHIYGLNRLPDLRGRIVR